MLRVQADADGIALVMERENYLFELQLSDQEARDLAASLAAILDTPAYQVAYPGLYVDHVTPWLSILEQAHYEPGQGYWRDISLIVEVCGEGHKAIVEERLDNPDKFLQELLGCFESSQNHAPAA